MNAILLLHVSSSWYRVRADGCFTGFLECRLAVPVLTPTQLHESPEWIKPFRQLKKNYSIIWIMVKPKSVTANSGSRETLVSKTFFSTLEYAAVPNSATDLFVPLTQRFRSCLPGADPIGIQPNIHRRSAEVDFDERKHETSQLDNVYLSPADVHLECFWYERWCPQV